jgi:predicted DNA binding protein
MLGIPMEYVADHHTEEIKDRASTAQGTFSFITGEELSERERLIYEIAYSNGYSDSSQDHEVDLQVEVLK